MAKTVYENGREKFCHYFSFYGFDSTSKYCWLLLARIAYGKKTLDPNYMGSFDGNSPLNFCDGCTHLIENCLCPKTNPFAEWYSFNAEWYSFLNA